MTTASASRNGSYDVETNGSSPADSELLHEPSQEGTVDIILSTEDIETEQDSNAADLSSLKSALEQSSIDLSAQSTRHLPERTGKRVFSIANRMAEATDVENLYQIAVTELRKRFQVERAAIYQFQSETQGTVIANQLVLTTARC